MMRTADGRDVSGELCNDNKMQVWVMARLKSGEMKAGGAAGLGAGCAPAASGASHAHAVGQATGYAEGCTAGWTDGWVAVSELNLSD
jgi:hypothetical protein